MAAVQVYVVLFTAAFFSGLMRLTAAQEAQAGAGAGAARVIDGKAIDQAVAYLLMFAALVVTYFAH